MVYYVTLGLVKCQSLQKAEPTQRKQGESQRLSERVYCLCCCRGKRFEGHQFRDINSRRR
jgi:hypothetical protein